MPFQRGSPRPAGAGRKKGVKYVHTVGVGGARSAGVAQALHVSVRERLAELGCDPVTGLAGIAMNAKVDDGVRVQAYRILASKVWPDLKAVEHSGVMGAVTVNADPLAILMRELARIAQRAGSGADPADTDAGAAVGHQVGLAVWVAPQSEDPGH